jgi:peptidoglycan/LPS O-acetylase OafA/YrhL
VDPLTGPTLQFRDSAGAFADGPLSGAAGPVPSAAPTHSLHYRPDIDGLRAVSVLAVILFHAHVPGFGGGYVGVDVFFVISGYLITQVILQRADLGVLAQLRVFYVRRCRRILPALLAMLAAASLIAWWLFLPGDLRRFGHFLAYTSIMATNVLAWREGGYFEVQSQFSPLLHLWSIAVEEQFYLAFPLFFLLIGRLWQRHRLAVLAACALASFALCVVASYAKPGANFFLSPTRAWELLLGAMLALGAGRALATCAWRDVLATASEAPTTVSRWLRSKPLVFTGLISYSLYLWHMPLLSFATYRNIEPLSAAQLAVLLVLLYALSAASWRFVEAPFRSRRVLKSDFRFLSACAATVVGIAAFGLVLFAKDGLPGRSPPAEQRLLASNTERLEREELDCKQRALTPETMCRYGPGAGANANVLVWGDSHAVALFPAYERIAAARNVNVHMAIYSGCAPLVEDPAKPEPPLRRGCGDYTRAVFAALDGIDPSLVILNAYWLYPPLDIAPKAGSGTGSGATAFETALGQTLAALEAKGRKVCVIGQVPTLDYVMPYAYAVAARRGLDPSFIALSPAEAGAQLGELNRELGDLKRQHGFKLVQPADTLCTGARCSIVTPEGDSLYGDNNHLSITGAHVMQRSIEGCFDGIG